MHKHSLPATEVSVTKGAVENAKCWRMMAVYLGKEVLVTHLALILTNFIIYLASVFLSVLTWNEILTFCTYFPLDLFFPPLIRDGGILEPFIIKRHSRNIHFSSVGLILAYTIKSWHLHKLAQSQLFVCSCGIFSKFEDPHFPLAAVTLCCHCWLLQTLLTGSFPDK